jgi:hypothetical protein
VDIRPVPPGWRCVHLTERDEGPAVTVLAMAEWLIQERQQYIEADTDGRPRIPNAERRVIAGQVGAYGYADPVDRSSDFWCILAPNEDEPSAADVDYELARRARVAAERAKQGKR